MTKFEFQAIGTTWNVDLENNLSKDEEVVLLKKIMDRIAEFDTAYSRFRNDSIITKISEKAGAYILPPDADKMVTLYKKIFDLTGGLVTPLIGQALVDLGYDSKYSFEVGSAKQPVNWDEVLSWKAPELTVTKPVLLDFGAGGKGYLVDIVSDILESSGVKAYCVDAGGDMRSRGGTALRVGLENPNDTTEVIGVASVSNQSICGSGGNRRKWADYNHIINPKTLTSPKEILSLWVIADETLLADLLATALFFVGPEVLLNEFKFEYLILNSDYSVVKSDGINAEVFTS
jgi:thiamine biosynthesis lipoprotein